MKKFLVLIIIMIYSIASLGITLNYFYCCGKLKSVSLSIQPFDKACCKSPKKDGKCCKNVANYYKADIEQKLVLQDHSIAKKILDLNSYIYWCNEAGSGVAHTRNYSYKSPPPLYQERLYSIHNVFRI